MILNWISHRIGITSVCLYIFLWYFYVTNHLFDCSYLFCKTIHIQFFICNTGLLLHKHLLFLVGIDRHISINIQHDTSSFHNPFAFLTSDDSCLHISIMYCLGISELTETGTSGATHLKVILCIIVILFIDSRISGVFLKLFMYVCRLILLLNKMNCWLNFLILKFECLKDW